MVRIVGHPILSSSSPLFILPLVAFIIIIGVTMVEEYKCRANNKKDIISTKIMMVIYIAAIVASIVEIILILT